MIIGLDTNVLVRYLTQDDPAQGALAAKVIERPGCTCVIQPLVLAELVWVLESAYGYAKAEIAGVLDQVLRTAQFEITDKDIVWQAFAGYRTGKGDFADYYIGLANLAAGAGATVTFDKSLTHSAAFRVLTAARSRQKRK